MNFCFTLYYFLNSSWARPATLGFFVIRSWQTAQFCNDIETGWSIFKKLSQVSNLFVSGFTEYSINLNQCVFVLPDSPQQNQFFFPKKRKEKNLVATNTNNEINSFSFLHIIVQLYIFLIKFLFWCVHSLTASCLLLKLGFYRRK